MVGLDACATRTVDPDRVAHVRERLVGIDEATSLAEQFKLLADPTRARLLCALLEGGELCVCDLAETVGVPESSVSHALRLLRTAGDRPQPPAGPDDLLLARRRPRPPAARPLARAPPPRRRGPAMRAAIALVLLGSCSACSRSACASWVQWRRTGSTGFVRDAAGRADRLSASASGLGVVAMRARVRRRRSPTSPACALGRARQRRGRGRRHAARGRRHRAVTSSRSSGWVTRGASASTPTTRTDLVTAACSRSCATRSSPR